MNDAGLSSSSASASSSSSCAAVKLLHYNRWLGKSLLQPVKLHLNAARQQLKSASELQRL